MRMLKQYSKNINLKLFMALLLMGFVPTIYTTIRTFFIGQLPGDWAYSIAGQLSWVNLLYEIIDEALILPLFFMLGSPNDDKRSFSNKIKTGVLASGVIYTVLAIIIIIFAEPMLLLMATGTDILKDSASYIRIESVANIFSIIYRFLLVAVVALGKDKYVYMLTGAKLILTVIMDTFLISNLPFSMGMGVNGIGYSNIIANAVLMAIVWTILKKNGIFEKTETLSFTWFKKFTKIGGISGLESFVRNIAYMLMVSRMVNMVGEQGTYWVANNFIWGWMLLPVLQLGELIKHEVSEKEENIKKCFKGYMVITTVIILLWIIAIPIYKPFMSRILGFDDVDKLFELIMVLFIPYITFAFQNVFDSIFYGRGRTDYMLFESIVTNFIYYGGMFIAYISNVWTPSLIGIALMFGIGNIFDAIVSWLAFRHFCRYNLTRK